MGADFTLQVEPDLSAEEFVDVLYLKLVAFLGDLTN